MVTFNKLFHKPGVPGFDNGPLGDNPSVGNLLPPGVNKGGVIPGSLVEFWFKFEILGICRLCLFVEEDLLPLLMVLTSSLRAAGATGWLIPSFVANDLSKGFGSKSNEVFS